MSRADFILESAFDDPSLEELIKSRLSHRG
jgi:hypothetical protein